jgi:hypothetical protein
MKRRTKSWLKKLIRRLSRKNLGRKKRGRLGAASANLEYSRRRR